MEHGATWENPLEHCFVNTLTTKGNEMNIPINGGQVIVEEKVMEMVEAKVVVVRKLNDALGMVSEAWKAGVDKNALCVELPVFVRMKELQKELGAMMLAVNKLRGL